MAFPSNVGSKQDDLQRAWDAVRGAAGQIKVNAENLNTASAAGPVEAARILRFAATLADANDVLSRYTGVPGLLAYVREQINDPAVDVVAEYNAIIPVAEVRKRPVILNESIEKIDSFLNSCRNVLGHYGSVLDVLVTSTGSRRQPLVVFITTAGFDRQSVCWEYHEYARKILDGIMEDATFFAFITAAEEEDDWQDPEIWKKANPNLGVSVKLEYLENECRRAQQVPAYQNTFRRLHLNQWTQQETRWLPLNAWDACDKPVDAKLLKGSACYGGLDLASMSDIASFVLDFPPEEGEEQETLAWLPFFWIPEENVVEL